MSFLRKLLSQRTFSTTGNSGKNKSIDAVGDRVMKTAKASLAKSESGRKLMQELENGNPGVMTASAVLGFFTVATLTGYVLTPHKEMPSPRVMEAAHRIEEGIEEIEKMTSKSTSTKGEVSER
eukprot:g2131.t1